MIYFDNCATTPMAAEVIETVTDYMKTSFGNPSSRHALGLEAEKIVTSSRRDVAKALGVTPDEVYFTSGGTESDNWAMRGAFASRKNKNMV